VIAPRSRLLWLVALVLVPASILPALAPAWSLVFVLATVGVLGLALADAATSIDLLRKLKIRIPEIVRLSKDSPGQIDVKLSDPSHADRPLRLALTLPETFASPDEEAPQQNAIQQILGRAIDRFYRQRPAEGRKVRFADGQEWSVVAWPTTPSRRGQFQMPGVHVERISYMGLWSIRRHLPVKCELRVYPNLLAERRHVAALFLTRGDYGSHAQRVMGKGREFEKLREYVPGDGYDELHWKATARRGKPITKVFQIERTQEVYVIIDASRLSAQEVLINEPAPLTVGSNRLAISQSNATGAPGLPSPQSSPTNPENVKVATTLERYLNAALVMALAAQRQSDLFGVVAFSNTVDSFVRSRGGSEHFKVCRDALYTLQPKLVSPDYAELFSFARLHLRRRALLVILTSLDDPMLSESFARHVNLVARKHLVMVNMIRPAMARPLFAQNVQKVGDIYRDLAGHFQWQRLRELERHLHRQGVTMRQLESESLCTQLVNQYMQIKRKQLL